MKSVDLIVTGCWAVFVIYWLVSALKTKPIAEKQSLGSALCHRLPLGFSFFLLTYPRFSSPLNQPLFPRSDATQIAAAIICVAGLGVTIWARRTLAGNWSSDVTFKADHELIQAGPYCYARHPIYTGLLVMCLGTAIQIACLRAGLALGLMFIALWIKLQQEEKLLARHFPDSYPAYRKHVKAIVPFLL